MKLSRLLPIAALIAWTFPASAATACYAPKQLRAEQLLRLHSELMVITVTCRQGSDGHSLAPAYTFFTRRNLRLLRDAEQTMLAWYKSTNNGDPVGNLDQLRTRLGNEYGQKAATISAPKFCAKYRDKVPLFAGAAPADLDKQLRRMETVEPSYVRACGKAFLARKGR